MTLELIAELWIPGEPVSKARPRVTKSGRTYTPEKSKAGEERVAWAFRAKNKTVPTDTDLAYRVEMHFLNGTRQRRDVDNMVKLILDGLNGVAWVDDNQVTEIEARKSYVPKDEAGTAVRIFAAGGLNRPTTPCLRCGTGFRTYPSWESSPTGKKYCSPECATADRVEKRERTCESCGKQLLAHGEADSVRFCSAECSYQSKRAELTCDHCGQTFTKQRCHVRQNNYCTPECQAARAKERRTTRFRGTCETCGAGVTKAHYRRCRSCVRAGSGVSGEPKITGPDMRAGDKRDKACVVVTITPIKETQP